MAVLWTSSLSSCFLALNILTVSRVVLTWYAVLSLFFVFPGIGHIGRTCFPFTVEYILTSTAALHYSVVFYQIKLCEHGLGEHCFRGGLVS